MQHPNCVRVAGVTYLLHAYTPDIRQKALDLHEREAFQRTRLDHAIHIGNTIMTGVWTSAVAQTVAELRALLTEAIERMPVRGLHESNLPGMTVYHPDGHVSRYVPKGTMPC